MNTKNNNRKGGFALTEVLLSVAVIIILGISGYSMYSASRKKAEALRIENAIVSLTKLTGENQRMIAPAIPANDGSGQTQYMDVMAVFSQLGLLDPSIFNNESAGQDGASGMIGNYSQYGNVVYIIGTQFSISNQITMFGNMDNHMVIQGNTDNQGCIYIVKTILPLFNSVSVNGVQVKIGTVADGNPGTTGTSIQDLTTACGTADTYTSGGTTYDLHNTVIMGDRNTW